VRELMKNAGIGVKQLKRTRIGGLRLGGLGAGQVLVRPRTTASSLCTEYATASQLGSAGSQQAGCVAAAQELKASVLRTVLDKTLQTTV
jgi:hypothetical protein